MTQQNCTINNDILNQIDISFKSNQVDKSIINYQVVNNNSKRKRNETSSIEIYMDIPEYEGQYQISNKGNVKSLKQNKETILNPSSDKKGYCKVSLYMEGKSRKFYIHRLVIQAFKGEIPKGKNLVVDHIDNVKTNNELDNLQVISNRENLSKDKWRHNISSPYTGVCFCKAKNKWESSIFINGTSFHLGFFQNETYARQEYIIALEYYNEHSDLNNFPFKTKRRDKAIFTDYNQLTINFS